MLATLAVPKAKGRLAPMAKTTTATVLSIAMIAIAVGVKRASKFQ